MNLLLKNEFQKIFLRKKTIVLLIMYTVIVLGSCLFLNYYGLGNYSNNTPQVKVNSLNLPILVAKESFFILNFIIFPLLFLDSFSGELKSGAYRMTLIRPVSRFKLLFSKYVSQIMLVFVFLAVLLIVSYIFGYMMSPHVDRITFSKPYMNLTVFESVLYTLSFYALLFLIVISLLALVSVISTLIPNTSLGFLFTLGFMIGSVYISDIFSYFILPGQYIFNQLNNLNILFFLSTGIIILFGGFFNFIIWRNKDFFE
ncbi:ABC transporter permease [Peribacillus sp. NPDC097295]|uniref:ABC transporter permease n=1 Tax=Peribacillus sp. NPDC097295 TaxID=3364402 RepID=UPI003824A26D